MAEAAQNIVPFPARVPPRAETGGEEGQVARAHRRALLARFGTPYEGASMSTLIECLAHGDPADRELIIAEIAAGAPRR